jgi:RNA polymerase sigma-70 factor (ECF subfamily)
MEESFHQIFRNNYRLVFTFFTKRKFSTEEAQDLTQETFLRIYKSMATFRGDSSFETWLFQVTANVYRNTVRSRSTQKRGAEEVTLEEDAADGQERGARAWESRGNGQLADVLADERARLLHAALEELPPQMRRCVYLRVDQDLKYREIAELMGVSIDTVKAHLFQARQILKEKLGDYFADSDFDRESSWKKNRR